MSQPSEEETRTRIEECLRAVGITDEPDIYGDGIHSWRCGHPDIYGKCTCFEEAIDYFYTAGLRVKNDR